MKGERKYPKNFKEMRIKQMRKGNTFVGKKLSFLEKRVRVIPILCVRDDLKTDIY